MPAPIVVLSTTTPDGIGPTRKDYRRAIGQAIGRHRVFTVTSTPSGHPDADREVVIAALSRDGHPPGRLDGSFLYACDGVDLDETRAIMGGTFAAGIGSVLVDAPYSTPLASGTEVEISWPLPGGPWMDIRSLNDFVQDALDRIVVPLRITMTGNGTRSYSVGLDYPYLYGPDSIIGVADSRGITTGYPTENSIYPAEIRRSGVGMTLVTGELYSTSETFEVVIAIPASRWVYDGTAWGYVTGNPQSLSYDSWQAAAPIGWVQAFGAAKALEWMITEVEADEDLDDKARSRRLDALQRRYEKWLTAAADIKATKFPKPPSMPERDFVYSPYSPRWAR